MKASATRQQKERKNESFLRQDELKTPPPQKQKHTD